METGKRAGIRFRERRSGLELAMGMAESTTWMVTAEGLRHKSCRAALGLDGSETRPYTGNAGASGLRHGPGTWGV